MARFKVRRFAAPRAGLARFEGFEAFDGFEGFEAFEGSIRQFRASRKRKPWLATAAGFGTIDKGPLRLPQLPVRLTPRAGLARFKVRRFLLQEPVWHVSRGLRLLQGLKGLTGQ